MTVIATLHRDKTRLSARASGLQAVPADVAALAASLRALDLSANELQALALPPALPVLEELLHVGKFEVLDQRIDELIRCQTGEYTGAGGDHGSTTM